LIAILWVKMTRFYSHKWTSAQGLNDDGTWEIFLKDLQPSQFEIGMTRCFDKFPSWPPTLGEFKNLCVLNSEDLNLPSFEKVCKAVFTKDWFHPIINEIYSEIGYWDLNNATEKDLRRRIKNIYDDLIFHIGNGDFVFKKPIEKTHRLENNSKPENKSTMSRAEAMKEMRESLGVKS